MIKAKHLVKGDKVAIIAPSTPGRKEKVAIAERGIKALGLVPEFFPSCFEYHGHLAGVDSIRLNDIHEAFSRKDIKGIICLKGGSGSTRLLDKIDYDVIKNNPKIFIGYSDITALHVAIYNKTGLVTFHGPMALSDMFSYTDNEVHVDAYSGAYYHNNLFSSQPLGVIMNPENQPIEVLVDGVAEGIIVGGNLSLLISTLGSPFEIDTRGKLLFIEDTNEPAYVVDRMLSALALAGKFRDCNGIILGTWTGCNPEKKGYDGMDLSLDEIFNEVIKPWGKPTLMNLYGGHNTPQCSFPLGVRARIDSEKRSIEILESGTEESHEVQDR